MLGDNNITQRWHFARTFLLVPVATVARTQVGCNWDGDKMNDIGSEIDENPDLPSAHMVSPSDDVFL